MRSRACQCFDSSNCGSWRDNGSSVHEAQEVSRCPPAHWRRRGPRSRVSRQPQSSHVNKQMLVFYSLVHCGKRGKNYPRVAGGNDVSTRVTYPASWFPCLGCQRRTKERKKCTGGEMAACLCFGLLEGSELVFVSVFVLLFTSLCEETTWVVGLLWPSSLQKVALGSTLFFKDKRKKWVYYRE